MILLKIMSSVSCWIKRKMRTTTKMMTIFLEKHFKEVARDLKVPKKQKNKK